MLFQEFKTALFGQGCFTSNQVYTWRETFDKNNIGRWVRQGLLIKLRNEFYTFPEFLSTANFGLFLSNCIYKPSYVSLHSALSFYGLIPEAVIQFTGVTTLKTNTFKNAFGVFSYQTIKPEFMFGFDYLPFLNDRTILMARPEKALLDLFYLYPFYNSENEIELLRLDRDFCKESLNHGLMISFLEKFKNKALENRINTFFKIYSL